MKYLHRGAAALLSFVVVLAAQGADSAQSKPGQAESASRGFSAERLQRINQFIEREMAKGEITGGVTLVARDGYGTHFWVDPGKKLVAIMLVQTPGQPRTEEFETAVMQALVD
jgi:CubicO group peptidase (beta-lactamase class C family)